MKTTNILKWAGLSLLSIALPVIAQAEVVELSGSGLTDLAASGDTVFVAPGEVVKVTLPNGETITATPGTSFKIVEEDGEYKVEFVSSPPRPPKEPNDPQGKPPYEKMKPFPEKIVRENLNDVSPS